MKNILMAQLAARLRGVGENIYRLLEEIGQIVVVTGFRPNSPAFFLANLIFGQGFSLFFAQFLTFLTISLKFWNEWMSCLLGHYEFVKDADEFDPRQIYRKKCAKWCR